MLRGEWQERVPAKVRPIPSGPGGVRQAMATIMGVPCPKLDHEEEQTSNKFHFDYLNFNHTKDGAFESCEFFTLL